jgi:hypothetical protein
MAEWISLIRKRGFWADVLHAIFNALFVVVVVAVTMMVADTPWPGVVLVLLSKWRVVAVRPRYWWANFLSSLPDVCLGFGVVVLIWQSGVNALETGLTAWPIQVLLGLFYALWLIFLKPQHRRIWVLVQSGASQFVSLVAIFSLAYLLPLSVVVLLSFITAFATARQVLGLYEEKAKTLLALVWGLAVAELALAAWHWTVAYQVTPLLKIPQLAIIVACLGLATETAYRSYNQHGQVRAGDIGWPVLFASAVTITLVLVFGGLWGI